MRNFIYIPVKDDNIDQKLAGYLNSLRESDQLQIMFHREGESLYQFGTKRVTMREEYGELRVRSLEPADVGGFKPIDEFIQQYTPIELTKLER